ncbi:MAG: shikimate kinase [Clostridia bacterium]|nr:shikimate kinase [Clostridia bacterium]
MNKLKNNIISLVGMTGCGKTSVGRILARKTGAAFIDLDEEIVARHGVIREIFDTKGEQGFRELERETLAEIIASADGKLTILSCGGGLPTYTPSRELLREMTTVLWLKRGYDSVITDPSVLNRPPVNGSADNYRRLMEARYPIYRACSDKAFYNSFPQRTAAMIIKKLDLPRKQTIPKKNTNHSTKEN